MSATLQHLEWDSEHFGLKCGKIEIDSTEESRERIDEVLTDVLTEAGSQGYRFVWTKTPSGAHALAHALEDAGFRLMDCELTLVHSGSKLPESGSPRIRIERLSNHPLPELEPLGDVFTNTRFHADPNIPNEQARGFWRKSVVNAAAGFADEVFVAFDGARPVGLVSCIDDVPSGNNSEKPVRTFFHVAIASDFQGCGIGQEIFESAVNGSLDQAAALRVATQTNNAAALNLYQRCGFSIAGSHYAFHLWL